jgi:hypothetical protein
MKKTRAITLARMTCHADQDQVDVWSRVDERLLRDRAPRFWKFWSRKDRTSVFVAEHHYALRCQGWRLEKTFEPSSL